MIAATVTVVIAVPCAPRAACSLSRFRVRGRKVPFFAMFRTPGLLDTRLALIVVNLAIVTPFAIRMIMGFIDAIPTDSEEAAMIDGASRPRVIEGIVLPMAAPGILPSSIFCFILTWNEFLSALILTRRDAVTLPVDLVSFRTERGDPWGLTSAAGVIIPVPGLIMALPIRHNSPAA